MTAVFLGYESDRPAVERYLAYHVASVVNNSDLLGSGVNDTIFLGSRVIPSPTPVADTINDASRSIDNNNDNSSSTPSDVTVALASTLSVAAVFFMFLIYFAVAKRSKRRSDDEDSGANIPVHDIASKQVSLNADVMICDDNIMQQPQQVLTNPTQSSIDSTTSDKSDEARCGTIDVGNRFGREVITDGGRATTTNAIQTPYLLTNNRTVSTVVSTDDSELYIEDDDTATVANITKKEENNDREIVSIAAAASGTGELALVMTDALPPKHPTGPTSKTLLVPLLATVKVPKAQRRRKKKKKKKVATIVRQNSRENIKEMETITEVEEETSGDNDDMEDGSDDDEGGEDGSWCSTSDSDPGSRDASPAPSSRDSSREPSPSRSAATTTSSSIGKILNVTDTLTTKQTATSYTDAGRTTTTTTSAGPSPDRTEGTEKPKPKNCLPTWI
jgi:hypothetical protein